MSTLILDLEAGRSRLREFVRRLLMASQPEAFRSDWWIRNGQTATGGVQGLTISDVDQSLLQQLLKAETELA